MMRQRREGERLQETRTRFAIADDRLAMFARNFDELGKVSSFIVATQEHDRLARSEGRKRLQGRIHVGRLGIVIALNTAHSAARLNAMLERGEALQARAHLIDLNTHRECCCGGCERIRNVVLTRNLQFVHLDERIGCPVEFNDELCTIHEGGILGAAGIDHAGEKPFGGTDRDVGEPTLFGRNALEFAHVTTHDIVHRVHHGHSAAARKVRVDALLRRAVLLEAPVPFQMIGRDVEQHRHIGRKIFGGGELIGGHFGYIIVGLALAHRFDTGVADVAHCLRAPTSAAQQMRAKRGSGGLAIRAGDGDPG